MMATLLIPTIPSAVYQSFKTRLQGRDFVFRLNYNEREARWYLSLLDEEETPLVQSVKLLTNWPLLRHYRFDPRLPPGELMAIDATGNGSPATIDELGEGLRCELTYFEA